MTQSLHTLAAILAAVEARLAEVEGGYGQTIYELRRRSVRTELGVGRILVHKGLPLVTDDEAPRRGVDAS